MESYGFQKKPEASFPDMPASDRALGIRAYCRILVYIQVHIWSGPAVVRISCGFARKPGVFLLLELLGRFPSSDWSRLAS